MKIIRVIFVIAVLCAPFYAQQVNTDIVPASPGLYLGHTNQRWNGYFNNADIYNLTINGSPIGTAGIGLPQISIPNGTNCTTLNGLVEFDGNGQAQTASLSSAKVIGVAVSGAGCSGNVLVQYAAIVNCTTDGSTLINDRIAASNSIAGDCMDIGPISIPGIQTVGLVTAVSSGAGQLTSFDLFTGDTISPSSSSGSGVVSVSPCVGPIGYAATAAAIVSWDCNTSLDGSGNAGFKKVTVTGSGAGKIDFGSSTTPGNPSAGFFRLYADSGTGFLTCLNSAGGNCLSAGTAFSAITSGTNTAAAMIAGSGSSLKPLNIGQVADSQAWLSAGIVAPTVTAGATSSGSLNATRGEVIEVTYVTASGETLPSTFVQIATNAAGCASNCSVTVTAPTLASGYTGYSVYACEINTGTYPAAACSTPTTLVRLASCTNITINCVITTTPSGATQPPTTLTAWIQPPNIQAATLVPLSSIPSFFFPKADGNYYPLAGMDFSRGNPLVSPDGTFEFWHRLFITDSGQNLSNATQAGGGLIRDALVSIGHLSGNATATGAGIDDRVLALRGTDSPTNPTYEQWLGIYGEQLVYNNNFSCGPVGFENCVAAIRARANDQRTAGVNNINLVGVSGTASTNVTSPKLGSCNPCVTGVLGEALQESVASQNGGGAFYAGVEGLASASAGNSNGTGIAIYAGAPTVRFASGNIAFYEPNNFTNAADFSFRIDGTAKSYFRGAIDLDSLNPLNNGTILMGGSVKPMGVGTQQLSSIGPTTQVIGVTGATAYTYKVVYKDVNGATAAASSAANVAAGNATLTGSNFNRLQLWSSAASQVLNCPSTIDIYRTISGGTPASTGKIGTFTVTDCTAFYAGQNFDDTGLAGDSTTPPTVNNTGSIQAFNYQTNTNCAATGSAASPSVAACGAAAAGSFSCATNAVNTCTVNTTAVTANSEIFISQREDTTTGTRLGVTCNVTPSVVIADQNITAVVAGTSFSFGLTQPVTNPDCFSYFIVNQ